MALPLGKGIDLLTAKQGHSNLRICHLPILVPGQKGKLLARANRSNRLQWDGLMVMDIFRNSPEQPSDSLTKNASCKDPILPQLGLHSMLLIQFLLIEDAQNLFMLRPGRTHLTATHEMAKQRGVAQAGGVEIEASPHGREDYFNAIGSAGYSFIHHAKLEDAKLRL